jgi:hypothetical protein
MLRKISYLLLLLRIHDSINGYQLAPVSPAVVLLSEPVATLLISAQLGKGMSVGICDSPLVVVVAVAAARTSRAQACSTLDTFRAKQISWRLQRSLPKRRALSGCSRNFGQACVTTDHSHVQCRRSQHSSALTCCNILHCVYHSYTDRQL